MQLIIKFFMTLTLCLLKPNFAESKYSTKRLLLRVTTTLDKSNSLCLIFLPQKMMTICKFPFSSKTLYEGIHTTTLQLYLFLTFLFFYVCIYVYVTISHLTQNVNSQGANSPTWLVYLLGNTSLTSPQSMLFKFWYTAGIQEKGIYSLKLAANIKRNLRR